MQSLKRSIKRGNITMLYKEKEVTFEDGTTDTIQVPYAMARKRRSTKHHGVKTGRFPNKWIIYEYL